MVLFRFLVFCHTPSYLCTQNIECGSSKRGQQTPYLEEVTSMKQFLSSSHPVPALLQA
ncbi:MAG: hypothetical protein K6G92_00355 [Bacteroidaceae bacterium]|nr:hypothetical protein [Bacteroidaceae bacterium]